MNENEPRKENFSEKFDTSNNTSPKEMIGILHKLCDICKKRQEEDVRKADSETVDQWQKTS